MALRDYLPIIGTNPTPDSPTDQILGHTAPAPDITQEPPPRVHQLPLGGSGRANFYGLPEPDELNRRLVGTEGLRRFDQMYREDPHIRRLILMAWAPIVGGTWTLQPHGGDEATDLDREVADTIWWALNKHMSPNFLEHLSSVGPLLLRSGFLPCEQIWGTCEYNGQTYSFPRKLDMRLPRSVWRWFQDDFGELTHIGQILPNRADVIIPASELVYYRLAPEGDNWAGTSLLRHCYKPWVYKDRLERIDAIGQERKAVGVPVVYRSPDVSEETVGQIEKIMANLHISEVAYVMIPGWKMGEGNAGGVQEGNQFLVDIVKFDSSSGDTIQASLQYHKQAIESSFAMDFMALGQHQVGARATAEVQEDPYEAAVNSIAVTSVIPPLDRLVQRICEVNWGDKVDGPPTLHCSLEETASLSEIATYLQALVASDVITPDEELEDWARDHLDAPPANADIRKLRTEAQKAGLEQAANPPDPMDIARAKAGGGVDGPPGNPKKPAAAGKQLAQPEPNAAWWERLLSQDRLREALDGCREHIEQTVGPAALKAARDLAHRARERGDLTSYDPQALADSLTSHYEGMYRLGQETVADELGKQRQALGRALDAPTDIAAGAAAGSRFSRARARGQHSAQNIVNKITEILGRQQISGLQPPGSQQQQAEAAALAALRVEALANTSVSINDGRTDQALGSGDVVGAYYTSMLDERTCGPCEKADDGALLSPDSAITMGPPNPDCEGADRCRCTLVWVLSTDPAALGAAF